MRVLRAFGIAFVTGIIGMLLAFCAAEWLTQLYHVSNFEGERAYGVVFLFSPLGFIVGSVIGFVSSVVVKSFLKAQSLALAATVLLCAIISGFVWLGADHPPQINGKDLALDFELKIPTAVELPSPIDEHALSVFLYASRRDYRSAKIDIDKITARDGTTLVPGRATLYSRSANCSFIISLGRERGPAQMIDLPDVPPSPREESKDWSNWITAAQYSDLKPVPEAQRMSVRYRVRKISD